MNPVRDGKRLKRFRYEYYYSAYKIKFLNRIIFV